MPNTPKRPDLEAIAGRRTSEQLCAECGARLSIVCTDIPALIAHIKALEARQVKLEAVVEAAREWRLSLEQDGWDKCAIEEGTTRPGVAKMMKALAALGDGDG